MYHISASFLSFYDFAFLFSDKAEVMLRKLCCQPTLVSSILSVPTFIHCIPITIEGSPYLHQSLTLGLWDLIYPHKAVYNTPSCPCHH